MRKIIFLVCMACLLMLVPLSAGAQNDMKPQKRNVTRLDKDYFIPGRFKDKVILVEGTERCVSIMITANIA